MKLITVVINYYNNFRQQMTEVAMSKKKVGDPILTELIAIKKLLILGLYGNNYPSEEIDKAVGMGSANIRGLFSKKNIVKSRNKKDE